MALIASISTFIERVEFKNSSPSAALITAISLLKVSCKLASKQVDIISSLDERC